MRLIDADKLKQDVLDWQDCYNGFSDTYDKSMIIGEIDDAPTIDAEPIKHGKWIKCENTSICSECGYAPISKIFFRGEKIWEISLIDEYHWCPCCGARMDADEISSVAKESAEKIADALNKVKAKGLQTQDVDKGEENV